MATIRDTVKLYIYRDRHDGRIQYFTLRMEHCDWLTLVGETTATVEYDDSMLIDPRQAELKQAEDALQNARAEFSVTEQQLIDRIQSLKALTHEGDRSEPLD